VWAGGWRKRDSRANLAQDRRETLAIYLLDLLAFDRMSRSQPNAPLATIGSAG
jgi:hypothetical protein